MATARPHHQSRLRSSSDPFTDPTPARRPPPPPPKNNQMPAPVLKTSPLPREPHRDITEAVRDTVTVRNDHSPRTRIGRSQTAINQSPNSRPPARRSQSQDSANHPENSKPSGKNRSKKGSQHADVIDRLDFTGVGPMFHHDGPFDACAPSRNRQRSKAPMFAWSGARPEENLAHGDSAYPAPHAYKAFSNSNYVDPPKKKVDAIAEAWGIHEPEPYEEFFAGGGTGKADGDTPASSIYNGKDSHNSHSTTRSGTNRRTKDGRDARDVYREYLEEGQSGTTATRPRVATRRTLVPPPQPIFVPDVTDVIDAPGSSPPLSAPGFPKRSKSLMHRIRQMRDAPNVPVNSDYDQPPSPLSATEHSYPGASSNTARPTHRPQNSFLGRLGGGARNSQAVPEKPEPFVYIEAHNTKALPATPKAAKDTPEPTHTAGYFDSAHNGTGVATSPGLGRRTSLMKKVGRVVGRSRQ